MVLGTATKASFYWPRQTSSLLIQFIVCIGYNLNTAHFTFSEKRINYYINVVVVGKSIQKRIITMITKTDDTIDSEVDQKQIMLKTELKIDKTITAASSTMTKTFIQSPENGSIEIILETLSFSQHVTIVEYCFAMLINIINGRLPQEEQIY